MAAKILSNDIKSFIVHALACYDSPSTVAEAVKQEFGATVTRQTVEGYDPTKRASRNLGQKWRIQFEAVRKAFKEQTADIPIANRTYRLRAMQRMFERAEAMKNLPFAVQILEQAAKECGDAFTNKQKIEANVKATARTVIVPAKG